MTVTHSTIPADRTLNHTAISMPYVSEESTADFIELVNRRDEIEREKQPRIDENVMLIFHVSSVSQAAVLLFFVLRLSAATIITHV